MDLPNLKPCPACGGDSPAIDTYVMPASHRTWLCQTPYIVWCRICRMQGPARGLTPARAAEAWNKLERPKELVLSSANAPTYVVQYEECNSRVWLHLDHLEREEKHISLCNQYTDDPRLALKFASAQEAGRILDNLLSKPFRCDGAGRYLIAPIL